MLLIISKQEKSVAVERVQGIPTIVVFLELEGRMTAFISTFSVNLKKIVVDYIHELCIKIFSYVKKRWFARLSRLSQLDSQN